MNGTQRRGAVFSAGLVLEDGFCKYLLLEKGPAGVRVAETISQPLDMEGGDIYGELFGHLARHGAPRDIPIAFALRFDESLIKIIDMQHFTVEDVKRTLKYQFDDFFPFAFKESSYDVQEIEFPASGKTEKRFMAVACRASVINGIKTGAMKAGYSLSSVEPSQVAFERAVITEDREENLIVIYASGTNVLFVLSNSKNGIFYRNAALRQDGYAYAENAAIEIRSSFDLACRYIPDFREQRAVIAGPCASGALREAVAQVLGHQCVESVDPFDCYGAVPDVRARSEMILPLGAALRSI